MSENNFNLYPFGEGENADTVPEEESRDVFSSASAEEKKYETLPAEPQEQTQVTEDGFGEYVPSEEKTEVQQDLTTNKDEPAAEAPSPVAPADFTQTAQPAYQPYMQTPPAAPQPSASAAPFGVPQQTQAGQQYQMPQPSYNPYVARTAANQNQGYYNPNPYQQAYRPNNLPPQPPYQPSGGNKGKVIAGVLIGLCVIAAIIFMAVGIMGSSDNDDTTTLSQNQNSTSNQSSTSDTLQNTTLPATSVTDSMSVSTTEPDSSVPNSVYVAEKVRPSVVGVMTYADGELYGEGSGVLMSEKDGWTYVVTCAHVINEEDVSYGILLLDGTSLEAQLVAFDTRTDIGVLKVKKTGLPLAEFGDSSTLKVGEPIYAIGNPGGSEYFGSITDGIVASIDRSVTSTYTMTCIQHNAAINPGNSGGALVNTAGQIIGINSSKIASTDFEGMGFAVPTSIASPIVDALISYGYVPNRPKLGIEYAPVSSYQLYSIIVTVKGLPQGSLVIAGISEDSSLVGTDAQVGDLIIGVNGKDMDDSSVLLDLIETGAVGDTLTLTLCRIDKRNYKTSTFDVTITLVEDRGSN